MLNISIPCLNVRTMLNRSTFGFLLTLFSIFANVQGSSRLDPLVDTKVGLIRGLRATDGDYSMFMGIPYAIVDETNPFGPSLPHPGFDEVFEAYDDSAICPQIEEFNNTIVGNLDCLHLNIYVPNSATTRNRLPVLVWIYGGGFSIGFSGRYVYGPRYLIRHDIILVTLNYRVGPYGFMCLDIPEVPGNQGLKDQLAALKWVKDNIESFGGDADKITIFGESAGGASVDFHLHFDKEILFHNAILQSGTAMGPWTIAASDKSAPLKLASHLGFETNDIIDALSFISVIDTKLIIAASHDINLSFSPCVEQSHDNVENFITDYPINMKVSRIASTPVLLGINNHEWLSIYANKESEYFEDLNIYYNNLDNYFDFEDDKLKEMAEIVRHFYNGDGKLNEETKWNLIDLDSDMLFNYPTERSIKKYFENGARDIYFYMFSYVGGRNFVKSRLNITTGGAAHADEISYLFDVSYMKDEPSPEDQLIIDRMTTMWTNFVKYGNPTPEISHLLPVQWTPVTEDIRYYLNIDSEMNIDRRPFHSRIAFWDLFYKLNQIYQLGYQEKIDNV